MAVRVETGARLHLGFQNLSLAHDRLYGGIGVALSTPEITIEAEPADTVTCADTDVRAYADRACDVLDVPGAAITVIDRFPQHVGLGSGTQLALATLAAVATAYDKEPRIRDHAPALNRGGRSGVGVALFERGGFVIDAGHPTDRFTTTPPDPGTWDVPAVMAHHTLPDSWRFVLIQPAVDPGRSGQREDASMQAVVETADPTVADDIAAVVLRQLLPAVAADQFATFGAAASEFGRLNGAWYADEQGGIYRPPAGRLIDELTDQPSIQGVGQSSWGPAIYGVTDTHHADAARRAAETVLTDKDVPGSIQVVAPRNTGATITTH